MLAVRRLCSWKSRSGTSGALTRASIVRKAAISATASASSPRVCNDVQPAWLPFTMA